MHEKGIWRNINNFYIMPHICLISVQNILRKIHKCLWSYRHQLKNWSKSYQPVIGHKSSMKEGRMYQGLSGPDHWKSRIFDFKIFWIQFIILASFLAYLRTKKHTQRQTSAEKYMHSEIFCDWINFLPYEFKKSNPGSLIHVMEFHLEIGNLMEN